MVGLEIKRSGFGGDSVRGCNHRRRCYDRRAIDSARKHLVMPVRIGSPLHITGLIDEILTPAFVTSVGLLLYGVSDREEETESRFGSFKKLGSFQIKGLAGKVVDLVKSLLP